MRGLYPDLLFIEAFKRALEMKRNANNKRHLYDIQCAINRLEKASDAVYQGKKFAPCRP